MKKTGVCIPTIIQNEKFIGKTKVIGKKKKQGLLSSVVIFQHNDLIEARYSLTLQEKRLILWLISRIQPDEEDFKKHTLSVQEFMNLMELKGHANYKELQKITLGLMKKILVIKKPDEKILTQVAWINYAHYEEGTGKIQISFSDAMRPFLLHLKSKFTAIKITDLMQFTSIHAIRVYELLKQYQNVGERVLSIEEIKNCCGVQGKLKQYGEFEKKLLLISQREINQKSDIYIEFERIKKSRKIVAIRFKIGKNKTYEPKNNLKSQMQEISRKPSAYNILRDFGLTAKMVNRLIKENTDEIIKNAIRAVDIQVLKGNVRNLRAMLLTVINERWEIRKYIPRK